MDNAKLIDYITSLLMFLVPVVIGLQPQVMAAIPAEYTIIAAAFFAILSQWAANRRVREAAEAPQEPVDFEGGA